jgi:hypothetical protein
LHWGSVAVSAGRGGGGGVEEQLQTEVLFVLHRRDHTTLHCKTKPKPSKAASDLFSS